MQALRSLGWAVTPRLGEAADWAKAYGALGPPPGSGPGALQRGPVRQPL